MGHNAPKGKRIHWYNNIEIEGDLHYCKSHNFVYNCVLEQEKLYNGQACFYTDSRFEDSINFYHKCYLYWARRGKCYQSLKACMRIVEKCKNIPVGTIVKFGVDYYYPGKKVRLSYSYKVKKENKLDVEFEINDPAFFNNFKTCERSKTLVDALRTNGFIVKVWNENPHRLIGDCEGETAMAWGYGKQIGFSPNDATFQGYGDGVENILWDKYGWFNKWSQCNRIKKTSSIQEILAILTTENKDEDDE